MDVPARVAWVVDLLDLEPGDHVLEAGCGSGVAAALVCARLDRGRMVALDRSETALQRARTRNAEHVAAGRLVLHQVELGTYRGGPATVDKAFAVNVNVFWTSPADAEAAVLARVLKPGGVLHLVYDGPGPGGVRDVGPTVAANLERHGFTSGVTRNPSGAMICISGRRPG